MKAGFGLVCAVLLIGTGSGHAQDAAAGEKVYAQCKACHQVGPTAKNGVGPTLNGLFGRPTGAVEGYAYSKANKESHLTWDEPTFTHYIKNPKAKIPGTKMLYAGLKDEQKIKDLIAYLHTFDSAPVSLIAK
jgi:cytochrome c